MSLHNIVGNEVGVPFIGGPNTGSIKGGRRNGGRAWIFILQGMAAGAFVLLVLAGLAVRG